MEPPNGPLSKGLFVATSRTVVCGLEPQVKRSTSWHPKSYHTFAEYGVANNVFKMMNGLIKVKVVQKKCKFHLIFILSSWLCMELVHDCCEQNGPTVPSERWEQWD